MLKSATKPHIHLVHVYLLLLEVDLGHLLPGWWLHALGSPTKRMQLPRGYTMTERTIARKNITPAPVAERLKLKCFVTSAVLSFTVSRLIPMGIWLYHPEDTRFSQKHIRKLNDLSRFNPWIIVCCSDQFSSHIFSSTTLFGLPCCSISSRKSFTPSRASLTRGRFATSLPLPE